MESLESKKNNGGVWRRLPPGFRFRPTDEELVVQYLWRKVLSFPLPSSIIPEIDLNHYDPKNLPGCIEREKEVYFFDKLKRSANGSSNEEKTSSGFWKAIGKEMPILSSRSNKLVGMKKVLIFFRGRCRTKWVMHEFRLAGVAAGIKSRMFSQRESFICQEKEWMVCRIFKKRKEKKIHERIMDHHHSIDSVMQVNKVSRNPTSSSASSSSSSLNLSCVTEVMEDSGSEEDECSGKSMDSSSYGNGNGNLQDN